MFLVLLHQLPKTPFVLLDIHQNIQTFPKFNTFNKNLFSD